MTQAAARRQRLPEGANVRRRPQKTKAGGATKPLPDWPKVHAELKRRGVTLMTLWEEHRAKHADGYGYSRFCELYGAWRRGLSPTMRQT